MNSLGVIRVTDFMQRSQELIEAMLLETNAHVESVRLGSLALELPPLGRRVPGMLHVELLPSLVELCCGVRSDELDENEEEGSGRGNPAHLERTRRRRGSLGLA